MALERKRTGLFSRQRWFVWTIGVIIAVIVLASFMSRGKPLLVRAAQVERGNIRSVISTNGTVEPVHNFEAHAPIGTTVKRVLVHEGDLVKKGQLLVELDDSEARSAASRALAQVRSSDVNVNALKTGGTREEVLTTEAQLATARTDRDTAQRNLQSLQKLEKTGAASPGEVKQAQDALDRAKTNVNLLEQKLKDRYSQPEISSVQAQHTEAQDAYQAAEDVLNKLNIRAPFEGTVYSLAVRQGNYVNPGDLILQEADLSQVRVRAYVDEPDVGRLSPGEPMEISWDALPGRIWAGKVNSIPSTLKLHGTRNVGETTCIVNNADRKLLPNVNVGVTIVTDEHKNVLTVPREAIRQDDDQPYVYRVVDDELQRQNVKISIANLTHVEITGGLQQNAMVALSSVNSQPLHEGLAVKVIE